MLFLDLATDALFSIGVIRANSSPSAEQGAKALRNLNQIMATLAGDGIDFGYAPTDDVGSTVALPLEDEATIVALLALKEASDRGIEPPALVVAVAGSGRERLLTRALLLAQRGMSLATFSKGAGADCGYNILTGD